MVYLEVDGVGDQQLLSPTYQKLSARAKHVLSVCRACRKFHQGMDAAGNSNAIYGNPLYFHFNRGLIKAYGLKNPNCVRDDLEELVKSGFIDVIEYYPNGGKRNIYAFSGQWKKLDRKEEIELSYTAKVFIQGKGKETWEDCHKACAGHQTEKLS